VVVRNSQFVWKTEELRWAGPLWFYMAFVVLILAAAVLIVYSPEVTGKAGVLAAVLIFSAACFTPVVLWRSSRVSPGFIYALATFINIGLGSLAWLGNPRDGAPGLDQQAIAGALLTLAAGLAYFWVGYGIVRPPRDVRPERPPVIVPIWVLFGLFVVGLASTAILLVTGQFGYAAIFTGASEISWWQQLIQTMSGLTGIAIVVAAIHAFGNDSKAHRWALVGMVFVSCGVGFLAGFKSAVLLPLAMTLFVYYYYRRRLPRKAIAAAIFVPLVLVPANLAYRDAISTGSGTATDSFGSVLDTAGRTSAGSFDYSLRERITATAEWGSQRFRTIDSVAQIERLTPSRIPYLGAESYAQLPAITLLPRLLWPGKPTGGEGVQFGRTYFGAGFGSRSSYAITNIGDLYLHSGPWGVAVGMVMWGAIAGLLFRWLWRRQSPSALVIYVIALFQMAQVEIDFTALISGAFRAILLAWVLGRLLYGPIVVRSTQSATRILRPKHSS
jgi:oligosaccharide repeat unit polymerase